MIFRFYIETFFKLPLVALLVIVCGCNLVDNQIKGQFLGAENPSLEPTPDGPAPPLLENLILEKIEVTSVSGAEISFSFAYTGDANNNADIKIHFCSIKAQTGCEPIGTEISSFVKTATAITVTIDLTLSVVIPGDFLKYKIVSSDSDGLVGGDDYGFVYIPLDGTQPNAITQFDQYFVGQGQSESLSFIANEFLSSMVRDAENYIYIAGSTNGSISEPNGGGYDVFSFNGGRDAIILKLQSNGELDTRFGINGVFQLGLISGRDSSGNDNITSLALDNNGNLFAAGYTLGSLGGPLNGGQDAFILKIDTLTGTLSETFGNGDGGGTYDNDGILQLNATNTFFSGNEEIITDFLLDDNGNLYGCGQTGGFAVQYDSFVIKLSALSGIFSDSFGSNDGGGALDNDGILFFNDFNTNSSSNSDYLVRMSLDANGSLFVGGHTLSSYGGVLSGSADIIVAKINSVTGILDTNFGSGDGGGVFDNDGILQINDMSVNSANGFEQFGDMILDGSGYLYFGGRTSSSTGGTYSAMGQEIFIAKISTTSGSFDTSFGSGDGGGIFDSDGILQLNTISTSATVGALGISRLSLDNSGHLYIAGSSTGDLGGPNSNPTGSGAQAYDGVLVKIDTSTSLLATSFGDGDGRDGDGVVQFNNINVGGGLEAMKISMGWWYQGRAQFILLA